ncbi:hypothetical protein [Streptomyces sp. NPDC001250]|uniref:hypothetical protein n=1 Tax=Streptomyces sp. NPDC001250 TaxID=3154382 RepID=UPI00331D10DB
MHDTFLARGIPTVFGEYGVLGYDFGPSGGVERGEMLKYFEAFGAAARTRGVATFLWDNGSFDRTSHSTGLPETAPMVSTPGFRRGSPETSPGRSA